VSFESDFLELMPHEITLYHWLSTNFHGVDVYDTDNPITLQCRISGKGIALRRREEEDDAIIVDIYADTKGMRIALADMIVLPEDEAWIDRTPEIFALGRMTDEDGHHHTKIQCGWMYHRQGQ
jgi:hypothetical protein